MEPDSALVLEIYLAAKKTNYERLSNEATALFDQIVAFEKNAHLTHMDESTLRVYLPQSPFIIDSIEFWKVNRVGIFNIKGQMMRNGLSSPDSDYDFFQELHGRTFDPPFFNDTVEDWAYKIIEQGHKIINESDELYSSRGVIKMQSGFTSDLIRKLAKINKYRFLSISHQIDGTNLKDIVSESEAAEIRSFNTLGTETFSELLTACVGEVRRKEISEQEKRNVLYRMTHDEGIIGQLMRVGGNNINNFEAKYIKKPYFRFIPDSPIIVDSKTGFISLDPELIEIEFPEMVSAHYPSQMAVRGNVVCPANQPFSEEDDSKIILHFVRKVIEKVPDSYLAA